MEIGRPQPHFLNSVLTIRFMIALWGRRLCAPTILGVWTQQDQCHRYQKSKRLQRLKREINKKRGPRSKS